MEKPPEIDPKMLERVLSLADSPRHAEVLINQAVEHLADELEIQKGQADIAAGRTVSHDEVGKWIASWGTDNPLPCPQPE